jgi:hypothetical protein
VALVRVVRVPVHQIVHVLASVHGGVVPTTRSVRMIDLALVLAVLRRGVGDHSSTVRSRR